MSYILDALNKAERERRLGQVPQLHQPTAPAPGRKTGRWLGLLGLLLGIQLLLAAGFWLPWQSWLNPAVQPATDTTSEPASSEPRIALSDLPLDIPEPVPFGSLPDAARQALGPLNLDLHVFASQPERRFVLINSQRYRPGDWLAQGVLLESIEADGVILSYQGLRFTLSAQP